MKILLVDDSKFVRLAHEKALTRAGYKVIAASDGELGLKAAREQHPDLILLDMMLPKLTGPELLKTLKRENQTKDIPVVVLTSLSQKNEAKLLEDGAAAFVNKAENILENDSAALLRTVASVLARRTDPVH
jgi:CheY-like chemotaxis protein